MSTPVVDLGAVVTRIEKTVPKLVRSVKGASIYDVIHADLTANTIPTVDQVSYVGALHTALAAFQALASTLHENLDTYAHVQLAGLVPAEQQQTALGSVQQQQFFANRYALFFAGNVGLQQLGCEPNGTVTEIEQFPQTMQATNNWEQLSGILAKSAAADLQLVLAEKKDQDPNIVLLESLRATFTTWVRQFKWDTYRALAEAAHVADTAYTTTQASVRGGIFTRNATTIRIDPKIPKHTLDDVIGGGELQRALTESNIKQSYYDFTDNECPLPVPFVTFTYGDPGCGKSFTAQASIRSFERRCAERGIPLWAFTLSSTDFASQYQNASANKLMETIGEINRFPGLVQVYMPDVDVLFQSRNNPQLSPDAQQVVGVFFRMFDGSLIEKNGRVRFLMDANYVDGIDEATRSRIFDDIIEVKRFTAADDFSAYARMKLFGKKQNSISAEDWSKIGTYLLEAPLSNREIDNILRKLGGSVELVPELEVMTTAERKNYRLHHLAGISADQIIGKCTEYVGKRAEVEDASRRKRFDSLLAQFQQDLETPYRGGAPAGGA